MNDHDEKRIERIESYLNNELSQSEREAFEKELTADKNLSQELESVKATLEGLRGAAIRNTISNIHESQIPEKSEPKLGRSATIRWAVGIAASIVFIALFLWFRSDSVPTNQELYAIHFEPYRDVLSSRGATDAWLEGMKNYTLGNYQEAIEVFEEVEIPIEYKSDIQFYTALSLLAIEKTDEAEVIFKQLLEENNRFSQQIKWYLGLSYLKADKKKLAIDQFRQIKSGEFKFQEAQQILKILPD